MAKMIKTKWKSKKKYQGSGTRQANRASESYKFIQKKSRNYKKLKQKSMNNTAKLKMKTVKN